MGAGMADRAGQLRCSAAEALRRLIADRRRRRLAIGALGIAAVLPLAATLAGRPPVLLLWNVSASAPIGLYAVQPWRRPRRGQLAIAWPPRPVRRLAAERRYLPLNVPLVKRVAAAAGDLVCAAGSKILVNGRTAAIRRPADGLGRVLPWWSACVRLGADDYLLLMDRPGSFDGRYFGPTRGEDLLGRAIPLWVR